MNQLPNTLKHKLAIMRKIEEKRKSKKKKPQHKEERLEVSLCKRITKGMKNKPIPYMNLKGTLMGYHET